MRNYLFIALLIIGCDNSPVDVVEQVPTPAPIVAPEVIKEPESKPEAPKEEVARSKEFLKGYFEGYNGNWFGPIRWTISCDFRNGRALGVQDRKDGLEPRYSR